MFNLDEATKIIKRQGELIHQYQKEHEVLLEEISKLKAKNEMLENDLYLTNKKKVEYRNQLSDLGVKIKSMLNVGKHASIL